MSAKRSSKTPVAKKPTGSQTGKALTKAKKAKSDGKMSAIEAAVRVLAESSEPMTTKQMIETMAAKDYWTSPGGATPDRTLYSAILREVNIKGKDARFVKTERGLFTVKR